MFGLFNGIKLMKNSSEFHIYGAWVVYDREGAVEPCLAGRVFHSGRPISPFPHFIRWPITLWGNTMRREKTIRQDFTWTTLIPPTFKARLWDMPASKNGRFSRMIYGGGKKNTGSCYFKNCEIFRYLKDWESENPEKSISRFFEELLNLAGWKL